MARCAFIDFVFENRDCIRLDGCEFEIHPPLRTAAELIAAARAAGVVVSYDLNYRESLWKGLGGHERARAVNRRIAPLVDVMLGNEEDFSVALGFDAAVPDLYAELDPASFGRLIEDVAAAARRAHAA